MNLESLKQFLSERSRGESAAAQAAEIVQIFSAIAASGNYPLAAADGSCSADIAEAISLAVNRPVSKIVFVSAASPDPALTGGQRFDGGRLWLDMDETLWERLHASHTTTLWDGFKRMPDGTQGLGPTIGNRLWEEFDAAFGAALKRCVEQAVSRDLGYDLQNACQNHVWYGLFYAIGFAVNGHADKSRRLAGLVSVLKKYIPIGQRRGQPGVWYVLAA